MHKIEFLLLRFLYFVFGKISFTSAKIISYILIFFIQYIFRYRRRVIFYNLHNAFPEKKFGDLKKLIRPIYKNFIYLWLEFLQTEKLSENIIKDRININNLHVLKKALKKNKGIILVSAHLGNFEWLSSILGILQLPVIAVAKKQKNRYVNQFLMDLRQKFGTQIVYKREVLKQGLKALKNNQILGLISDQNAGKKGVFIDFFNQPASTVNGPAIFYLRTKAPLIAIYLIRKDYACFDLFAEEIQLSENLKLNDDNIRNITQAYTANLEKWVRKYPEQYFWMHRRWKTKPEMVN